MEWLKIVLTQLGLLSGETRLDAKQTATLEKQLEYVKAQTYDILLPKLKAREYIPVSNEVDPGAETITYRQWDSFGMAQIISNYADDLPTVEALSEEYSSKVKSIATSYQWSIQDLRRSAMANSNLPARKAAAARLYVESKIEDIAAIGASDHGLYGIANNVNITLSTPVTGAWISTPATGAEMIADLNVLVSDVINKCKEALEPNTILLDLANYTYFASTRISTTGDTNQTALKAFLESSPHIKQVGLWNKLATADAAGTGPRFICYLKDPQVLTLEIPQEFEQLPAQAKNLAYVTPCHARCGGVIMYYPIAVGYMDGC